MVKMPIFDPSGIAVIPVVQNIFQMASLLVFFNKAVVAHLIQSHAYRACSYYPVQKPQPELSNALFRNDRRGVLEDFEENYCLTILC